MKAFNSFFIHFYAHITSLSSLACIVNIIIINIITIFTTINTLYYTKNKIYYSVLVHSHLDTQCFLLVNESKKVLPCNHNSPFFSLYKH